MPRARKTVRVSMEAVNRCHRLSWTVDRRRIMEYDLHVITAEQYARRRGEYVGERWQILEKGDLVIACACPMVGPDIDEIPDF